MSRLQESIKHKADMDAVIESIHLGYIPRPQQRLLHEAIEHRRWTVAHRVGSVRVVGWHHVVVWHELVLLATAAPSGP